MTESILALTSLKESIKSHCRASDEVKEARLNYTPLKVLLFLSLMAITTIIYLLDNISLAVVLVLGFPFYAFILIEFIPEIDTSEGDSANKEIIERSLLINGASNRYESQILEKLTTRLSNKDLMKIINDEIALIIARETK